MVGRVCVVLTSRAEPTPLVTVQGARPALVPKKASPEPKLGARHTSREMAFSSRPADVRPTAMHERVAAGSRPLGVNLEGRGGSGGRLGSASSTTTAFTLDST